MPATRRPRSQEGTETSKSPDETSSNVRPPSYAKLVKQKRQKSRKNAWQSITSGLTKTTQQSMLVLIVAMAAGIMWNYIELHSQVDEVVKAFLKDICSRIQCHPSLEATRRTQRARESIPQGTVLAEIPRKYQIWDIDALRDDYIRELPPALKAAAYLAAYLAKLLHNVTGLDPVLQHYLRTLPTYEDFLSYHPVFWSEGDLNTLQHTVAYDQVMAFRAEVNDEYTAFGLSPVFDATRQEYFTARLNVMTRAFGTGPLSLDVLDPDERAYYEERQVDLSKGCYSMVPILDMYDHHGRPNVGFSYVAEKDAFVIEAIETIPRGQELFDSYGKRSDGNLLGHYGFINGDGSDFTEASIAVFHAIDFLTMGSPPTRKQQAQIVHYIKYDDGYAECVDRDDPEAWELKKLKFLYLLQRANDPKHWVQVIPPRRKAAKPPKTSDKQQQLSSPPPKMDLREVSFDANSIFSTCRVITLTHWDYERNATSLIRQNLVNSQFVLPPTDGALEFRTLWCMARLAVTALDRLGSIDSLTRTISTLSPGSREWTIASVKLGEMQSLEALKQIAFSKLRVFGDVMGTSTAFSMREHQCPLEVVQHLVEDVLIATPPDPEASST